MIHRMDTIHEVLPAAWLCFPTAGRFSSQCMSMFYSRNRSLSSGSGSLHCSRRPNQRYRFRAMPSYSQSRTGRGTMRNTASQRHGAGKNRIACSTASERVKHSPLYIRITESGRTDPFAHVSISRAPAADCKLANRRTCRRSCFSKKVTVALHRWQKPSNRIMGC